MASTTPKTTKEQIIEATRELLYEQGNVTIKEISERAYVNVASINYHFGSKDKLVQIIIEQVIADLRKEILDAIMEDPLTTMDVEKIMTRLVDLIFNFVENHTGIINYSILQMATQAESTNVLINLFLVDNQFTNTILGQLKMIFPDTNDDQLFAKYIILFSSFIVPFFLNFTLQKLIEANTVEDHDYILQYKDYYVEELKRFLTPRK